MQEVFEKIIEKIKADSSVKLYGSKNSGNYLIPVHNAIEIVKQEAEQYEECYKDCRECEAYDKEKYHCPKFCKVIKETVKEIEENHNGWIPCSERLPERNKAVLIYMKSTTISGTELIMVGSCDNGFWFVQDGVDVLGFPCYQYKVMAWQPLPEPYQSKGE